MGTRRVGTVLVAALLVGLAAGCRSTPDDDTGVARDRTAAAPAVDEVTARAESRPSATASTSTPATLVQAPPDADLASLDRQGLLAAWAADREAAVERISNAGWGVDEADVLQGPGGLRVDLAACPAWWADVGPDPESDTVVLSWWVAYHGVGPERAQIFLDWLGDEGLVGGRPIEIVPGPYGEFDWMVAGWEDEPERRLDHRAHLGERVADTAEEALAVVGFAGLGGTLGIELLFDEVCLPSIGRRSALAPVEPDGPRPGPSPWLVPSTTMRHETIGRALAELARREFAADRIGVVAMGNEFGDTLVTELLQLTDAEGFEVVVARHDPAGADVDGAVATVMDADPDVVIAATAGYPCVLVARAFEVIDPSLPVITPEYCANPYQFGENDDGALDDLLSLRSVVDGTEEPVADTELGRLATRAFGQEEFNHGSTAEWAPMWQAVQILQIAADLPGGLTRSNIAIAGWSFEGRFPLVEGAIVASWPDDEDAVSSARLHRWDGQSEAWQPTDLVVGPAPRG